MKPMNESKNLVMIVKDPFSLRRFLDHLMLGGPRLESQVLKVHHEQSTKNQRNSRLPGLDA